MRTGGGKARYHGVAMLCQRPSTRVSALFSARRLERPRKARSVRAWQVVLLSGLLALVSAGLSETSSEACKAVNVGRTSASIASPHRSPAILGEGYRAASAKENQSRLEATHLWLQFDAPPVDALSVVLEPVWGSGPASLQGMWGQSLPLRNSHVFVYPNVYGAHRDQAFTLGVRARYVYRDGSVSAPSLPVFISHAGEAATTSGIPTHHLVFALASVMLLGLWWLFRREPDAGNRIRLAAATALVSLLFLAVSPALSWVKVEDPSGRLPDIQCHLGDEAQCATYVPDAGPNPLSLSEVAVERRMEVARWIGASAALRVGLILSMVLLMPAIIWLLVAPGLRSAQTSVALGASAAGYTLLAVLFYRLTMPSWMSVTTTRAFDLGVVATLNIVIAAAMIIYWSFRLTSPLPTLPSAVAREQHRGAK